MAFQKTSGDLGFIKSVKQLRFFIWNLVVLDLCLFGTHELLHHKPIYDINSETFFSILSYVLSVIGLCLALYELILLCNYSFKFYDGDVSYVVSEASSSNGSRASRLLHHYELVGVY